MIYTIYKLTNLLNGKIYIGYTQATLEKRFASHVYKIKQGSKTHIHNAIRLYGPENFVIEAIYQSKDMRHCKDEMETHFINEYNSHVDGYNLTMGGEGFEGKHSEETKKKLGDLSRGRQCSEHTRKLRRQNAIKLHQERKIGMYGKKQTPEFAAKKSREMLGNKYAQRA